MIATAALFIFIGGLLAAAVVSISGRVYLALAFLMFMAPLQNVLEKLHRFPMGDDFIDIILLVMLIGWVLRASSRGEKIVEWTPLNKVMVVMVVFTFLGLWQGSLMLGLPLPLNPTDMRVQMWKNYIIFPLLFFIAVNNVRTEKEIRVVCLAMIAALFVTEFYTGKQIRWMPSLVSREKISGTFVWAGVNVVAAFFAQYIFILVGIFLMHKERFYRLVTGGLAVMGLYITLFLYSRGAYLALLGGALTLAFIRKRVLVIPIILILLLWQSVLPASVIERINMTQGYNGQLDTSSQYRLELWSASMKLFQRNPLTGVGFATIPYVHLPRGFMDTHNIYVKMLAEQGMVGLLIMLVTLWISMKMGLRLYKSAESTFLQGLGLGMVLCVVATAVTNFFGDRWTYLQIGSYYWVLAGMTVRGIIISEDGEEDAAYG
jgi:O-antigen ligase